jgi:hypothetical protein
MYRIRRATAGYAFVMLTFSLILGRIIWSYNAEIAPAIAQAQVIGLSATSNLFFNGILVSPVIGNMIILLGFEAFWLFVVIMAVGAVFFYWIVETKDQSIAILTEKWEKKLKCEYTGRHHATANKSLGKEIHNEQSSEEHSSKECSTEKEVENFFEDENMENA